MVTATLLFVSGLNADMEIIDTDPFEEVVTDDVDDHRLVHRLLEDVEQGIARVEPWLERYGYGAVFALVGIEGAGVPAPGLAILEAGAVMAAMDTGSDRQLHVGWLVIVAVIASTLGSMAGYLIGRTGGRGLLSRLPIPGRHQARVESAFQRHGAWFIVFARFFDGPRQLHAIAAGVLGMPWRRFLPLTFIGALLWVGFWVLLVYYIDLHLDQLVYVLRRVNPWVAGTVIASVAVLGGFLLHKARGRRHA